ncbi:hypothetical protein D9M72_593840 [compost metagenome]
MLDCGSDGEDRPEDEILDRGGTNNVTCEWRSHHAEIKEYARNDRDRRDGGSYAHNQFEGEGIAELGICKKRGARITERERDHQRADHQRDNNPPGPHNALCLNLETCREH